MAAKNAKPDGYTFFVSSLGPFVIGPHLLKNSGYDATKDFDYITVAVQAPNILAVRTDSPHKTLADVIKFHKANPEKMTFASAGNGTSDHLTAELFWQETGTKGTHIPYKVGAPALTDLLGGQVDATFMNINTGMPHVKAGKLRPLAITSTKRSPLLPDVPTMEELGYKGFEIGFWSGLFLAKATPPAIVNRVSQALIQIGQDTRLLNMVPARNDETVHSFKSGWMVMQDGAWSPLKATNVEQIVLGACDGKKTVSDVVREVEQTGVLKKPGPAVNRAIRKFFELGALTLERTR